jgi:hypothetical protein
MAGENTRRYLISAAALVRRLSKYIHEKAKGKKPALMYWISPFTGKKWKVDGR